MCQDEKNPLFPQDVEQTKLKKLKQTNNLGINRA